MVFIFMIIFITAFLNENLVDFFFVYRSHETLLSDEEAQEVVHLLSPSVESLDKQPDSSLISGSGLNVEDRYVLSLGPIARCMVNLWLRVDCSILTMCCTMGSYYLFDWKRNLFEYFTGA